MAEKNPYELANRGKAPGLPSLPTRQKMLTDAEQREKLEGYMLVPKEFWPYVKYSTHVRYTRVTGEFRTGGFVVKNPFDIKTEESVEKRCIQLQNNFNKGGPDHQLWHVAYDDIAYLYVKGNGVDLTLQQEIGDAVAKIHANCQKLGKMQKILEQRMAAYEQRLAAFEQTKK